MPISCLLPISMPYTYTYTSRTNPIFCTKQPQFLSHPLFTKYDHDQQHKRTTRVLQSVQKPPRLRVTSYANLKPDCFELENENSSDDDDDHVRDPLGTVSDLMEAHKKKLLAVIVSAISVCHSYKALSASGGVMGSSSFSSSRTSSGGSSKSSSYSSSSKSSKSSYSSSSSSKSSKPSYSSSGGSSSKRSYSSSSTSSKPSYSSSSPSHLSSSSWSSSSPSSSSNSSSSWSSSSPSSSSNSSSSWSSSPSSSSHSSYSWSSSSDTDYNSKPSKPYQSTYSDSTESKYTTSTSVAPEMMSSTKTEAPSNEGLWILIVLLSIVGIAVFCAMRKDTPENDTSYRVMHEYTPQKTGVIKFQVALLGSARSFQCDINEIAKVADTSSRRGFKNILTESLLALNRHSAYWELSHLSVYKEQCVEDGERRFSGISFEERSKFDQETLVNLDSSKRTGKLRQQLDDPSHDYIVVTFIVAVLGILELPTPKSRSDLTAIVQKLRSIHEKDILAVQVLWTPQDEEDTLSSERVLKDYPLLQPL